MVFCEVVLHGVLYLEYRRLLPFPPLHTEICHLRSLPRRCTISLASMEPFDRSDCELRLLAVTNGSASPFLRVDEVGILLVSYTAQ